MRAFQRTRSPDAMPLTLVREEAVADGFAERRCRGVLTQLGGAGEGPYPLPGPVEVLVIVDQAVEARELLLADQVESIFDGVEEDSEDL